MYYLRGTCVTKTFDKLERVKEIWADHRRVAAYEYSGPGRVSTRTYANGTATHYNYDKDRRNNLLVHNTSETIYGAVPVAGFAYQYDQEDNRMYEARVNQVNNNNGPDPVFEKVRHYKYDSYYRIAETLYGITNSALLTDYQNAWKGTGSVPDPQVGQFESNEVFVNDAVYNITDYTDKAGDSYKRYADEMHQYYRIDKNNEVERSLEYDGNGNLTYDGERRFYYDYKNRMREVYVANLLRARYTYDGKDCRISKTVYEADGVTMKEKTLYIWDGWQCIEELDASGRLVADYVYGRDMDEPLRMRRDLNNNGIFDEITETFYYHENSIGSICAITDAGGNPVEYYDYTTYGIPTIYESDGQTVRDESAISNPYYFHGRRVDWETEIAGRNALYYHRNRVYSPQLQRFLQPDPKGDEDSMNLYPFCSNNPVNYTDPTGLYKIFGLHIPGTSYETDRTDIGLTGAQWGLDVSRGAGDVLTFNQATKAREFYWGEERAEVQYKSGYYTGVVGGVILSYAIGNVGGAEFALVTSLGKAPGVLVQAVRGYRFVEAAWGIYGAGAGAYHIATGEGKWTSYIALAGFAPAVGWLRGTRKGFAGFKKWVKARTFRGFREALRQHKRSPYTKVGRALTKHPNIVGVRKTGESAAELRRILGGDPGINKAAAGALKEIMRTGRRTIKIHADFGMVIEYKLPSGLGARFGTEGKWLDRLVGFLGQAR